MRTIQTLCRYLTVLVIGIPALAAQNAATSPLNSIVIGQSADLSGPSSALTQDFLSGANAYFDHVNAQGGVNGRPVVLVTLDDKSDPDLAAENTKKLLGLHNLAALFGYVGAKTSVAALALIGTQDMPFIAPITGSRAIFSGFNRNIFTVRASYANEYEYLLSRFSRMGLKKFAVFNDGAGLFYPPSMPAIIANARAELVASENHIGQSIEQVAEIFLRSRPDVILTMSSSPATNIALIKELRAQGYAGYFYCASLVCKLILNNDFEKETGGLIISQVMPDPLKLSPPVVYNYRKLARQGDNPQLSYLGLEGFIAAKILVEGLRRTRSKITPKKLILALESINEKNYPIPGFRINFSSTNHQGSTFVEMTAVDKNGRVVH